MSKRCPDCGQVNDDSRIFCSACGEPLNSDIRLIQGLEKQKTAPQKSAAGVRRHDEDDDYVPTRKVEQKKSSPMPWIILGIVVLAAAAWFFLH